MGGGLAIPLPPSYEVLLDDNKTFWDKNYEVLTKENKMSSEEAIKELDRQARIENIMLTIPLHEKEVGGCDDKCFCRHPYFNKWEGKYICMDCWATLDPSDPTQELLIKAQEAKEANTLSDTIPTNIPNDELNSHIGKMSQQRGVSIGFLWTFTKKFNCWDKSSWWIIRYIIKPMTQTRRCRFVELDWMEEYVGPAHTFISYAQQGTWGDLVAAILDGGADLNRKVWLDIFAVRQWPSDSPDLDFASTIAHCNSFMCVCSYVEFAAKMERTDVLSRKIDLISANDRKKIAFLRVWCLVEIAAAAEKPDMPRIMKCGGHSIDRQGDIDLISFTSNNDLFVRLGFMIDINNAEATVESDKDRILNDIEKSVTIDHVNHIVRGILLGGGVIAEQGTLGSIVQCAACGDPNALQYIVSEPNESLLAASSGGYVSLVEMLLDKGVDVNAKNNGGMTALMFASVGGHNACLEILLDKCADADAKANDGTTALMLASAGGHSACLNILSDKGVDVNAKNNGGMTALMFASAGGHIACLNILSDKGVDVDAKANDGTTALMWASDGGHNACLKVLLEKGADVNSKASDGRTALLFASKGGHSVSLDILLEKGADVNAKANDGMTALMLASGGGYNVSLNILLEKGADVNAKAIFGATALLLASKGGHNVCLEILLEKEVDVDAKGNDGMTALMWASDGGYNLCLNILLEKGADVNAKTIFGATALLLASKGGHIVCEEILLKRGAV